MGHYRRFSRRLPGRPPAATLDPEDPMPISHRLRRNRLIALIAAVTMVVVLSGYGAHALGGQSAHADHCDWSMHFTGVAGAAAQPVALARPVPATRVLPAVAAAAPRSLRRLRAHPARGPPLAPTLS
jgi:hypothetical protein